MKTAISIPNETFNIAEHFASLAGMSRSELYTKAIVEYIDKHKNVDVTEALNKVYDESNSSLDKDLHSMQIRSLPRENW